MDKPQIIAHVHHPVSYTVYDCKWVPRSAKLVVLGAHPRGTGALELYEISKGELKLIHKTEKPKQFKCGTFGASNFHNRSIATGDFEGKLQIWDIENLSTATYSAKAHKEIINCIDGVGGLGIGEGAPEIATGSRDGDAFNSQDRCLAAGYDNGDVKLFDMRKVGVRWETNLGNGVCGLQFDRKDIQMNKLVATCLESKFHVFDMRTQHPVKGFAHLTEKVPRI